MSKEKLLLQLAAWAYLKSPSSSVHLHYPGYLTPSSATPPISASYFAFVGHSVLALESKMIGQYGSRQDLLVSSAYPHHCFSALQLWESYVLISFSFQEKYIPERCFHVCHIMEEKVFSLQTWQAARSPNQTTRPRARRMGGEIACICLLRI